MVQFFFCFFSPTISEIYFYVCDREDHYEKTQGFSSVRNESGAKRNIFPIVLALLCRMKKRKRRDLPMNFGQKVQPFGWQKKESHMFYTISQLQRNPSPSYVLLPQITIQHRSLFRNGAAKTLNFISLGYPQSLNTMADEDR